MSLCFVSLFRDIWNISQLLWAPRDLQGDLKEETNKRIRRRRGARRADRIPPGDGIIRSLHLKKKCSVYLSEEQSTSKMQFFATASPLTWGNNWIETARINFVFQCNISFDKNKICSFHYKLLFSTSSFSCFSHLLPVQCNKKW